MSKVNWGKAIWVWTSLNYPWELTWDWSAWTSFSVAMVTANCSINSQSCKYKKYWQVVHISIYVSYTVSSWSPTAITFSWLPYDDTIWNNRGISWANINEASNTTARATRNTTLGQFVISKHDNSVMTSWSVVVKWTFILS
jgi:hypothetical protein